MTKSNIIFGLFILALSPVFVFLFLKAVDKEAEMQANKAAQMYQTEIKQ